MKKIQALIAAFLLTLFGATKAYSDFAVGVSGGMAFIDATGTETEGSEQNSKNVENDTGIASIFFEYTPEMFGGLTLGIDYIPGGADVSDQVKSRTDVETSVTGDADQTTTSRSQKAQAEIDQHITYYGKIDLAEGIYVKAGIVQADLNTLESLGTGSKYGNDTLDGYTVGIGIEGDVYTNTFMRAEYTFTDYEEISLRSSVARTGVSVNNKVTGDIDVSMLKLSLGYKF